MKKPIAEMVCRLSRVEPAFGDLATLSPRPGPGSEPAGVPGGTRPRSLRLAHRPNRGRRGPTRLRSLFALLIPAGAGPCRVAELGAPALHALRFSPYPRRCPGWHLGMVSPLAKVGSLRNSGHSFSR